MQTDQFERIIQKLLDDAKQIRDKKGADYTSSFDRLSNFKSIGSRIALDPFKVWAVYFLKHVDAVSNYAAGKELKSESIDERFCDLLNYLLLGYALLNEQ